jgi:hypothetical protein
VKPTGNLLVLVHSWPDFRACHEDEYDFSKAKRGKFYRQDAMLVPPVQLEPEVLAFLSERANARGVPLNELINTLLKKNIELIEAAK